MMHKMLAGVVVAVSLLMAAPAAAQTPPAVPGTAAPARPRMNAMRGRMLRERVGLDEATAQRVEQVLGQFDSQHAAVREQIRTNQRRIRQLIRDKSNDQAAYRQAVDGLRNAQLQQETLRNREFDELRKILLPSQQAKLLMHLQRLNREGRGPGAGAGPRRTPGAGPGRGPCGAGNGPCGRGQGPAR